MPAVSIPILTNLAADSYNDRVVDGVTNSLFGPLQGGLDAVNIEAGQLFDWHQFRPGSSAKAWTVGGTESLDYRSYWFSGVDASTYSTIDSADKGFLIPKTGASIFVPVQGVYLLEWTVMWGNEASNDSERSFVAQQVDGVTISSNRRQVRRSVAANGYAPAIGTTDGYPEHYGYQKNRVYSGHHVGRFTPGYHTVGLEVLCDETVRNTRVWARSMKVLWLGPS